ncbi:MAG: hypothetical protein EAZ78_02130 [Oscillatoriales cyanobacterium]|nr:MAG: hypothetical protein EA000_08355 [Oscillatoriales cyanobacterium]TAD96774.1 MAG: hypothetical protein EAZ98_11625 [Oscillatoriales cyanobacterium]TAE04488.1 MAG: hypothetical protein EAZ96_09105 [Oscillatoriales cyanobacterium]TAF06545.1 MAG: hypothetical protein EAZ78_02130 [Oscillatoriales cyanobacterium]TAF36079.1 MAG: hypothetical protein EAZ68_17435 [Oscillatoriales cyanobacterium]
MYPNWQLGNNKKAHRCYQPSNCQRNNIHVPISLNNLNIKSEQQHIPLLYNILFTFTANQAFFLSRIHPTRGN